MRGQVGGEPVLLWGARPAAADLRAVAVDDDDVPGAEVVAVVALLGVACRRAKVLEVAGSPRDVIVVIARSWPGTRLVAPQVGS